MTNKKENFFKSILKKGLGTLAGALLVAILWGCFSYAKLPNQNKNEIKIIKEGMINLTLGVKSNNELLKILIEKE